MEIQIKEDILEKNDRLAAQISHKLAGYGVLAINLLGSPGSGKTTLLEHTIAKLKSELSLAIIEGDLFTSKDAERIEAQQVPVVQINTGGGCHLDAAMVDRALDQLPLEQLDLLIIENVGNLVCPAEFFIGEDCKVTLLSVTEGEDKPLKYPLIFKEAEVVLLSKSDLLPYVPFDLPAAKEDITSLRPSAKIFPISCRTGDGLDSWFNWVVERVRQKRSRRT